ncbi:PfkB family carbohydrate kinase [Nocardia sp. NPDC050406]|uniref:PfkB family carbohydrate kinase n=1 Tax=Nocardia sp. NPDC050406 TaxID=3364318 RepID=UPI0037B9C7CF
MAMQHSPRDPEPATTAQDTGMLAVRNILSRLGKRSGLSPERLRGTEIDVDALLKLPVVQGHATHTGLSPAEAVPGVIRHAARRLAPTERLIVDAELALGLLRDNPPDGVDLTRLYAAELGDRRKYLIERWRMLHEKFGAEATPRTPTVRTLRGEPERRAFTALAQLLTAGTAFDATDTTEGDSVDEARGRVTVVGDAVIDQIFVVDEMPVPGSSSWCDFEQSPGGKGLNRAVAAARLGLRAQLLAAVGDDGEGQQILSYLRLRGVDPSLIAVVRRARTPVTAVIQATAKLPANLAYKDDRLRLHAEDLESPAHRGALATADVVLLTFEQPLEVIVRALDIVATAPRPPWVIVSASPPLNSSPRKLYRSLRAVHYVIGTPSELERLASDNPSGAGDAADRLLVLGVDTVCTIDGFQLRIRSRRGDVVVSDVPTAMAGSSGAYAAFSAALAYRLATRGKPADETDFAWAVAAMTATQSVGGVSEVMPSVAEIDDLVAVDAARKNH